MAREDPLLRRTRVEAANALTNAIIDVINAHMLTHGLNDPKLPNMLLAAFASIVDEIEHRVDPDFGELLADMITGDHDDDASD